jgi:hypothetical protein
MRSFIHQAVHVNEAIRYQPVQLYKVQRLVLDLILVLEKHELWFERCPKEVVGLSSKILRKTHTARGGALLRDCIEVVIL